MFVRASADYLPRNFGLSSNGTTLTLGRVCKRSVDGVGCSMETDSGPTVIQCNASNEHGYVFANGYINVLGTRTVHCTSADRFVPVADPVACPLPKLTTNFLTYVRPDGFLWHSDFTKFNFGWAPPRTPLGKLTTLTPSLFPILTPSTHLASRQRHRETATGGGPINPISGSVTGPYGISFNEKYAVEVEFLHVIMPGLEPYLLY